MWLESDGDQHWTVYNGFIHVSNALAGTPEKGGLPPHGVSGPLPLYMISLEVLTAVTSFLHDSSGLPKVQNRGC